jgi:hypothetical protein
MTITRQVFMLAVVLVTHAAWSRLSAADDRPDVAATPAPNAAVIYWQAFSELPELLAETEKEVYEAAAANPNALESAELKPIVARFEPALHDLHRAVRVPVCDWNLDYDAGPECRLPHIQSARALAKAALVRARLEFATGSIDDAVADGVATLKLARDCASSRLLISLLVGDAIEKSATEVLAASLSRLSPAQLDQLSKAIVALPAPPSAAACIRNEGQMFAGWLSRSLSVEEAKATAANAAGNFLAKLTNDVVAGNETADADNAARRKQLETVLWADVQESVRLFQLDYEKAAALAALPAADRGDEMAAFEAGVTAAPTGGIREAARRALSRGYLPAVTKFCKRVDEAEVRRQLLLLAITVQQHGAGTICDATIPGYGPVSHHVIDAGFELRCQPASTDKPIVLMVR